MSIEEKTQALAGALAALITEIFNGSTAGKGLDNRTSATPPAKADKKKTTKKELDELKKAAKAKAGSVMKKHGKDRLAEVLAEFGAEKFPQLKNEPEVFNAFIEKADAALAEDVAPEDDDLLGGDPTPPEKKYTVDDVKGLLLKVNNADGLGRDTTRQILADLGVARLPDLTADKYAEAVEKIEAVLKEAGVK